MVFQLTIETDNAAFEGHELYIELIRLLKDTINSLEHCIDNYTLHDINGNRVGEYIIKEGEL